MYYLTKTRSRMAETRTFGLVRIGNCSYWIGGGERTFSTFDSRDACDLLAEGRLLK
jgi:hypothetical protein